MRWIKYSLECLIKPKKILELQDIENFELVNLYLLYASLSLVVVYFYHYYGLFLELKFIIPLVLISIAFAPLFNNAFLYFLLSLLGNVKDFVRQFKTYIVWFLPLFTISLALSVFPIAQIVLYLYSVYLTFLTLKKVHEISDSRIWVAVLAFYIIQLVVFRI